MPNSESWREGKSALVRRLIAARAGSPRRQGKILELRSSAHRVVDEAKRALGERERDTLEVFGHFEIGLVERQRLNDRRVFGEDLADLPAVRLVDLETRFDCSSPFA